FEKIGSAVDINKELHRDLQTLLRILSADNRAAMLKAERIAAEKMLEQLKDVIRKQERLRAQTEQARRDTKDIAQDQGKVKDAAKDLIGEGKDGKGAEGKNGEAKSHGKDNAREGAEGRGEGKNDTSSNKADGKGTEGKENKGGDGQGKEGKGEDKDGKG